MVFIFSTALSVTAPLLAARAPAVAVSTFVLISPLVYAAAADSRIRIPQWAYRGPQQ
jgi:hypothetical protein